MHQMELTRMHVSVIVPTYGRPGPLERCISALAAQTRLPDQVLVVVRDEDVATHSTVGELVARFKNLPVTMVTVCSSGKSRAINAALERAVGDIICFTDDDAEPFDNW